MDPQSPFRFFVGVDWASEEHMASILDASRSEIEKKVYPHSGSGLNVPRQLVDCPGGNVIAAEPSDNYETEARSAVDHGRGTE